MTHFASLAVIPTLDAWDLVDERFGRANFHWFFLAQPFGLPEKLLSADPQAFIDAALARMAGGLGNVEPFALDAYRRAFQDPDVRHAICEDYRAAAQEDRACDAADRAVGRKLSCPVLVLWPQGWKARPPSTSGADGPTTSKAYPSGAATFNRRSRQKRYWQRCFHFLWAQGLAAYRSQTRQPKNSTNLHATASGYYSGKN